MPRRKYGRLQKIIESPSTDNCSRCRSGKHCPIPGHSGFIEEASRKWKGPNNVAKRTNKKNPSKK